VSCLCKKISEKFDVAEMIILNRFTALGRAAGIALDHLGDFVISGILRKEIKVVIPLLAVCVLLGSALWLMFQLGYALSILLVPWDRLIHP